MKTQVIVLNGGSSSGKSAIARDLQAVLPEPWLSLSVDTLVDAMPARLTAGGDGIGFADDGGVAVGQDFMALQDAWIAGLARRVNSLKVEPALKPVDPPTEGSPAKTSEE